MHGAYDHLAEGAVPHVILGSCLEGAASSTMPCLNCLNSLLAIWREFLLFLLNCLHAKHDDLNLTPSQHALGQWRLPLVTMEEKEEEEEEKEKEEEKEEGEEEEEGVEKEEEGEEEEEVYSCL